MWLDAFTAADLQLGLAEELRFTLLESLEIKFSPGFYGSHPFLPNTLPRVKNLKCSDAPESFVKSFPASGIMSLCVSTPITRLSVRVWIDILQKLPTLESLSLAGVFELGSPAATPPPLDTLAVVELPHLKTLTFFEDCMSLSQGLLKFFEHCRFPPSTKVLINLFSYPSRDFMDLLTETLALVASGSAPNKISMPPFVSCKLVNFCYDFWTTEVPVSALVANQAIESN